MITFKDWEESSLDLIAEIYRRLYEAYGPQSWWPAETWFEVVVGAVLTQNTAWKNVEKAIENLKLVGLLEPRKLYETNDEFVGMLIKPAGFWKLKARRLKNLLKKLSEYDFDFYRLRESLTRDELLGRRNRSRNRRFYPSVRLRTTCFRHRQLHQTYFHPSWHSQR